MDSTSTEQKLRQKPWLSDQGDGTFVNPVLHADYSDPDIIRAGDDFYMTASSFGHLPGLPILHSNDLINWRLINHVLPRMDLPNYDVPQHGNGVWAPALRFHAGKFWVFYGDPDVGIFMSTSEDPAGEWTPLHLVQEGKGLIDPCPFWDDDGEAYLVHAFARSRCGIKHILRMCRMSPDGTRLLDEGRIVYDGTEGHPTMEGPKMYKRNGYYYIFAPAGGVSTGWQTVLRSASAFGPYEDKVVLHQGGGSVNGPHQGGWVELASGECWFMHFQDKGAYGRIAHLQPMRWSDDWPVMGADSNGDGIGEPVMRYPKPNVGGVFAIGAPDDSDEFEGTGLGLQWQWQANPNPAWYSLEKASHLRLFAFPVPNNQPSRTLYYAPHLLLQKFPAEVFQAEARLDGSELKPGERAGLIVFGRRFAYAAVQRKADGSGMAVIRAEGGDAEEKEVWSGAMTEGMTVTFRVSVDPDAMCRFHYAAQDGPFLPCGEMEFQAEKGHWVGAKVGLFAASPEDAADRGYADIDWFRIAGGNR
ncbi:glycoside hydrolase family 43 protein [Paenibacillus arenilitoris]|uniref:Glycoside hydrolase 43 family protein n=1 Tax=Paenibacillus arenilitoris TaxID=2772299 RepID=A0A927CFF6_9BACL|nr:glycoside hydrolase 43 family protein [Paenibacillus arenilitoris]MBD2867089.1 glycoside hydrolase 43 family protein [Paenibacillus arenilitoris]